MPKIFICSFGGSNAKSFVFHRQASVLLGLLFLANLEVNAEYSIPAGRIVSWHPAGLDVVGGIPTAFAATNVITGLHPDGSVNDATTINNAISAATSNTVLTIPAGKYKISANILMKNGVVLRGAKASVSPWMPADNSAATTLLMTSGAIIYFNGGSRDTAWTPGIQSGYSITAGYTQGSTALTLSSASSLSVGDYVAVYQNKDSALIDDKGYNWLGEDSGSDPHVWAQYTKVTGKSGNTITIDPPLYQVTPSPTGQSVRKQTFGISMAGLENLRLSGDASNLKLIFLRFSKFCWVKGVETYNVGANSSGSPHIWAEFCYANEYRRNYLHHGAGNDSGANYGIEFYHWNSRHKIEDNIVRETRHSIIFEGGGSGCVILYNYTDDNWESVQGSPKTRDNSFLSEDLVSNHGAHPYMNLWEGNAASSWWGDYTQGSSSHNTAFRNSFSGRRTSYPLSSPWLWIVIDVEKYNRYYNLIGNIVGNPTMSGGTVIDNGSGSRPTMFRFGYSSAGGTYDDSQSYSTAILHGNYDFVSKSVNNWAGTDHTLPVSLYYTNAVKPSWFGDRPWPPYDYSRVTAAQIDRTNTPAGYRFVFGVDPVTGNKPPVASATATTPTTGLMPLAVTFSSIGSSDPEGVALSHNWNFGDGNSSTAPNPSHTYTNVGSFVAQLTVSDGVNSSLSSPINIVVTNPISNVVVANLRPTIISATPTKGAVPLTVNFSAGTGWLPSCRVSFGDGSTSTDPNAAHTYGSAGSYNVTVYQVLAGLSNHVTTYLNYITATNTP